MTLVAQSLQTGNGNGLPELKDYLHDENNHRLFLHHQAIIDTYRFNCCGNITKWGVEVFRNVDNAYSLDFQVWRPSPTVNDSTGSGCYSLVGNNRFTSISLSGGTAIVVPSPQDYIRFQSRDVLGFYVENTGDNDTNPEPMYTPNGVVMHPNISFTSELVWYASITPTMTTSQSGDCPYSVGSNGILNSSTHAAPVISIDICKYFFRLHHLFLRLFWYSQLPTLVLHHCQCLPYQP